MTSVDKQLNCVFWFQNPLKDLVRPLYNYSRTDPVRSPDSPSLYMSCVSPCLCRSLLYRTSLFANNVAKLYCWEFYFPILFLLELFGENFIVFMSHSYCLFIYFLLECFGENVGVFILQRCLFCWLRLPMIII